MSLWLNLHVGTTVIGSMEILRVTNTGQNGLRPDDVSKYSVWAITDDREVRTGFVEHRYGDGPWVLLRKATEVITNGVSDVGREGPERDPDAGR